MSSGDWILPTCSPLCLSADSLYRAGQAIFQHLTAAVTPDMNAAAQEALAQYRTELVSTLHPIHFGVSVGMHVCVEDVYQEAKARLRALAATSQPVPTSPAPPPTAQQPPIPAHEVVNNLRRLAADRTRRTETYLGTDDPTLIPEDER
jgi:hypothetical protein